MDKACSANGRVENYLQNFVRKFECKGPLGRSRRRWKDNINWDLEIECEDVD